MIILGTNIITIPELPPNPTLYIWGLLSNATCRSTIRSSQAVECNIFHFVSLIWLQFENQIGNLLDQAWTLQDERYTVHSTKVSTPAQTKQIA